MQYYNYCIIYSCFYSIITIAKKGHHMEIKKVSKLSSKTKVQELQPDPKRKYRVHDSDQSELCILVYPSGKKSWEIYKKIKGTNKIKETILGNFPDLHYEKARIEVQKQLLEMASKVFDTHLRSKVDPKTTLSEWFYNEYIPKYCCDRDPKTNSKDKGMFKNLLSSLHTKPLFSIQKAELMQLRKQIKDSGLSPQTANRAIGMLKAMFNILIKEDLSPDTFRNPAWGIKSYPEEARHVFITPEHLPFFMEELEKWPNPGFINFVKLSLFSGLRENEILQLKWSNLKTINLKSSKVKSNEVVHIENPKGHNRSGSKDFAVSAEFKNVLKQMDSIAHKPEDYLFPSREDTTKHVRNYTHVWIRFLERLKARLKKEGIEFHDPIDEEPDTYVHYKINGKNVTRKKRKNHMYRIHDLRRSVGAYMVKAGRSCEQIAKVLGNTPAVVQKTYSPMLKEDQQVYLQSGMAELTGAMKMK